MYLRATYVFTLHVFQLSLTSDDCQLVQLTQRFAYCGRQYYVHTQIDLHVHNLLADPFPAELAFDRVFDDRIV